MSLQDRILIYLRDRPSTKSRELASALKADKTDINRILYGGEGWLFLVDKDYRWTVLENAAQKTPLPDQGEPAHSPAADIDGAAHARRTLARLKRGVPPDQGVSRFAVGMGHLERRLESLLRPDSNPRWFALTGEYGEGKSFFRALATENALDAGFAVASFDVNRDDGALHQPQRHLSVMLNTLRSPLPNLRHHEGIVELVRQWSTITPIEAIRLALLRLVEVSPDLKPVDDVGHARRLLSGVLRADDSGMFSTSDYLTRLISLLSSTDLVGRSPYARFSAAFRLQLIIEWLVATGHKGLFLFIDEIDNIARQIAPRGHPACFRTLAWYCSSASLAPLRVVFAMTPEMRERIDQRSRQQYGEDLRAQLTVRAEEYSAYKLWNKEAELTDPVIWEDCSPLRVIHRMNLYHRIVEVHQVAWGKTSTLPDQEMEELARSPGFTTTRRWVRACVQILDTLNQNPVSKTGGSLDPAKMAHEFKQTTALNRLGFSGDS